MAKQIMPAGAMNLDKGPAPGDHLWVAKGVVWQGHGYEKLPAYTSLGDVTVTNGHMCRGAFNWLGGYDQRIYMATDAKFYEVSGGTYTEVTGTTTPTNSTNGVTFAGYGEWAFAANGVDKIQAIKVPESRFGTTNFADMVYTTDGAKIAPKYIWAHKNHLVAANIKFVESWAEIASHTTAVGGGFTQPAGSVIEVVSSSGLDITQTITVYGTYTGGGDAVAIGTATLNGATAVDITNPNGVGSTWQKILGWQKSAATVGDITLRKDGGGTTINIILAADVVAGISNVATDDQAGGGRVIDIVCSATASTKQVGIIGTNHTAATIYDSQALDGTITGVQSNYDFTTVTNVLTGDVANTDTINISSHVYPRNYTDPYLVWWSGTDDPEGYGNEAIAPQIIGSSDQPLLDGNGKITGGIDGGDCFFVFKEGSIHRFDGPPFQPTVISWSVGMSAKCTPYRQGDRVYFWSKTGLNYINIADNSITNPMERCVQRSVVESVGGNYGLLRGYYPDSRQAALTPPLEYSGIGYGGQNFYVSIAGDVSSKMVYMAYDPIDPAQGTKVLLYNEIDDQFTVFTPPVIGILSTHRVVAVSVEPSLPTMLSAVRVLAGLTTITHYDFRPAEFLQADDTDCYLRWPFFASGVDKPRTRIKAIRPIFNDSYEYAPDVVYAIQADVISINGTGKSWVAEGVLTKGRTAYVSSKDGWLHVEGCPYADKHSIGVSIRVVLPSAGGFGPGMQDFTHIEVEYVEEAYKGI